jgi:glycosyltransferase involved in cell wall biosynthesis
LGVNKKFKIIPNGADPDEFLPRNPKNFFIANCRWRPHKRLKETIECFLVALEKGLDADLIVTGSEDYKLIHDRIKYIGWQKKETLKKLFSKAIGSLHLTWLDWCPNSMVEAIVSRCPVIYTKSGGHHEIGNNYGIAIKDTYLNWKLIDLYSPPSIDEQEVVDAMIKLKREKIEYPINEELNIKNVSNRYIEYFKQLLG